MKKDFEVAIHQNETQRTLQGCSYTIKFLDLRSLAISANSSRIVNVAEAEGVEKFETRFV